MPTKKRDTILIVSQEYDPHSDTVVCELNRRGVPVVRLHTSDFPEQAFASLELCSDEFQALLTLPAERTIPHDDIRSVWYRRPGPYQVPDMGPAYTDFARSQCAQLFNGLWKILDCYWVSHPTALRVAEFKPYQLHLARQLGLRIPRTLITNDPRRAKDFCSSRKKPVIHKVLKPSQIVVPLPANATLDSLKEYAVPTFYTTIVTDEHLKYVDSLQHAPAIFQEYIEKKVELRVTVMGRRVFAAEIHSQASEQTKYDWRNYPTANGEILWSEVPYYPHHLPPALEAKLVQMVELLGLQFGAIDLILTPENEYVFLEINPNGQWQWIEDLTGMPMLETFVNMLVEARPAEPL